MTKRLDKILAEMEKAPHNVRFASLASACERYFGAPRQKGTSHHVYKTPWPGDPRVNIQQSKDGRAKAYQVRQVLAAIRKLQGSHDG